MFKKIFLVGLICSLAVSWAAKATNAAVMTGEPRTYSAKVATDAIQSLGFDFEGGWCAENRTFLKVMKEGSITVYMKADAEGKELKFLSMQMPPSLQDEAKKILRVLVRSMAYAKGAKSSDLVSVEAMFQSKLWPEVILKYWGENAQIELLMYNIAVTMEKLNNGNVYFEVQ